MYRWLEYTKQDKGTKLRTDTYSAERLTTAVFIQRHVQRRYKETTIKTGTGRSVIKTDGDGRG